MPYETETASRIPYEEYKAITELMHAHLQTHKGKLRALIAFGEIVTRGGTFNIDLLEVVADWHGPASVTFSTSPALLLRGQLHLYLLTPEEFEGTSGRRHFSTKRLLAQVRGGYDIVYEDPPGYARNVFAQTPQSSQNSNPLEFLVSGNTGQG